MNKELQDRIAHYLHESVDYTHDRQGRRTGEDCQICMDDAESILRIVEHETKAEQGK